MGGLRVLGCLTILAATVVMSNLPAFADGVPSFGSGGLKAQAIPATAGANGHLQSAIVVTNTSNIAARVFLVAYPSASDNAGHAFEADALNNHVTGIFVCHAGSECLGIHKDETELNSTIIDPNGSINIVMDFHPRDQINSKAEFGDLVNVGMIVMAQAVREETTATGSKFVGGAWRSVSLGVSNIPLK